MADTRNPREVVDIGRFQPYTHPQYGAGAIREVEYIDGTIERRFFHYGTEKDGEGAPDSGYLVDSKVNPEQRDKWERNKPSASASTSESVSAPPTQSHVGTRGPDGTITWSPNPNYKPPEEQKGTTQFIKGGDGKTYAVPIDAQGRAGTPVDSGLPAEARAGQVVTIDTPTGKQVVQIDQAGNARVVFTAPAGVKTEAEDKLINGVHHTRVEQTTPGGSVTVTWLGPDGKALAKPPTEGEASVGGPQMPQFGVSSIEQALTATHRAIYSDPNLTPEARLKRFQEAVQVANIATQNLATLENQRESDNNLAYNVAGSKLTAMQSGLKDALTFVSDLNGKLPEGSGLGGQAFAAILGLQALQMKQSGIDNVINGRVVSASSTPLPVITNRDLNDPAALTAHNQAIAQQAAQAAAPAPQQNAGAGTGEPPSRGNVPAQPGAAPVVAPVAPTPSAVAAPVPPQPTDETPVFSPLQGNIQQAATPPLPATPDADPLLNVIHTPTGERKQVRLSELNGAANLAEYQILDPNSGGSVVGATTAPTPAPPPMKQEAPDYGTPGMQELPQPPTGLTTDPAERVNYGEGQDMPKVGALAEWPALAAYGQQAQQSQPAPQQPQAPDFSQSPALLRVQAASKPPWEMTEQEYEQYKAAGIDDDLIMSVPQRRAVA